MRHALIPIVALTAIALVSHTASHADDDAADSAYLELIVGDGGVYEVPVHESFVTVLYLPDEITKAQSSDKDYFWTQVMGDTVSVRPKPDRPATAGKANLNIKTDSVRVTIILKVVDKAEEAVAQVRIRKKDDVEELEKRVEAEVEKRTAPILAQVEKDRQQLDAAIRDAGDREVARRLVKRFDTVKLEAIDRSDDNVIVRVKKAVFVGEDAYLFFEIQNRSGSDYRLADVSVATSAKRVDDGVEFQSPAAGKKTAELVGVVPDGQRGRGVVILRNADSMRSESLTLQTIEPKGRGKVSVDRIKLK